jgi:hypothetical protein
MSVPEVFQNKPYEEKYITCKEVGLEVNTEKTKYTGSTFMSCE